MDVNYKNQKRYKTEMISQKSKRSAFCKAERTPDSLKDSQALYCDHREEQWLLFYLMHFLKLFAAFVRWEQLLPET